MNEMNALCQEKHDRINEKLEVHDKRLNAHAERLDNLSADNASFKMEMKALCKQIEGLTATLKWFIGLLGGSFVAFFFYMVQQNMK
jgi:peptidoglycan hydrolase CwlO-like protein